MQGSRITRAPMEVRSELSEEIQRDHVGGWDVLWRRQTTPWNLDHAAPPLVALIDAKQLGAGRALVPGCGQVRFWIFLGLQQTARETWG